jgi:cobalt-zinc-cadmium efflux system outer membrane protein
MGNSVRFMYFPRIFALFVVLVVNGRAAPSLVVTESSIGQRVRAQNPDLAAARLRIAEALGRNKQAGRLSNPTLDGGFEHNSSFREGRLEIGFTQRFPLTDRLRLEKEISATQLQAAEKEVAEVERQLVLSARQSLIQVLAIRQRRELLRKQSELAGRFAESVDKAANRGEESSLDAAQARMEGMSVELEMRQLDAAEATAEGALKPLLGMRPDEALSVSGSLDLPVRNAVAPDPSRRPDLQLSRLNSLAAGQQAVLERAKRYDDMEAGAFVAGERSEDAPDGYDNEAIVGIRFKIPLPLWNKNEGAIEEADARRKRKEMESSALARTIGLEIETARTEMDRWGKLSRELGDTLLPLAETQVRQAEEAYGKGQTPLQAVFRLREKQLQLAGARLDALREFHLARARYEAACGQP